MIISSRLGRGDGRVSRQCTTRCRERRVDRFVRAGILGLVLCLGGIHSGYGADLWVDVNSLGGPCSNDRAREQISASAPWCDLGVAANSVEPGDRVWVRAGVYSRVQTCAECTDNAILEIHRSGTADQPIEILAFEDERVVLTGLKNEARRGIRIVGADEQSRLQHVRLSGFEVRDFNLGDCLLLKWASDITIDNMDVHHCARTAFEIHHTERVVIESNRVHDNPLSNFTSAIDLFECGIGNIVRRNAIWNNTDEDPRESEGHGIIMDLCTLDSTTIIENNLIWNNEGWCIVAYKSPNGVIRNNVCWKNGENPGAGEVSLLGKNQLITNNIIVPREGHPGLYIRERTDYPVDLSKSLARNNLVWAPGNARAVGWSTETFTTTDAYPNENPFGWGRGFVAEDPRLRAPERFDFRPYRDSPAIDAGVDDFGPRVDFTGRTRTRDETDPIDIGAYEVPNPATALEVLDFSDDSDADGMADAWEIAAFANLQRDGAGDFDNDGVFDLNEFLRNSNPLPAEPIDAGRTLWVDVESRGGPCSDTLAREDNRRERPWCQLASAGVQAIAGDTIIVRGGVYSMLQQCDRCKNSAVLEVLNSGTREAPIRFIEATGEAVVLDGTEGPIDGVLIARTLEGVQPRFIEVSDFELRHFHTQNGRTANCVKVADTSDVILRRLDVHDCTSSAVEFHRTDRTTIEFSRIYNNALDGYTSAVDLFECGSNNIVRGNLIYANSDTHPAQTEGHGIIQDTCPDGASALIENNIIWGNEGWCIVVLLADGALIRNNTCWHNGERPDSAEMSLLGERIRVYNNIIVPTDGALALLMRTRNDYPVDLSQSSVDGNLIFAPNNDIAIGWGTDHYVNATDFPSVNPFGWGTRGLSADPRFEDPQAGDFSLRAGSAAIDAALSGASPSVDLFGARRPFDGDGDGQARSDIGALEFGAVRPPPGRIFLDDMER